jgi:hypothetical protein
MAGHPAGPTTPAPDLDAIRERWASQLREPRTYLGVDLAALLDEVDALRLLCMTMLLTEAELEKALPRYRALRSPSTEDPNGI